ncbi:hypothetical protein Tco_0880666 [Tanacetum coccineum]
MLESIEGVLFQDKSGGPPLREKVENHKLIDVLGRVINHALSSKVVAVILAGIQTIASWGWDLDYTLVPSRIKGSTKPVGLVVDGYGIENEWHA